jgi:hypothetical protein
MLYNFFLLFLLLGSEINLYANQPKENRVIQPLCGLAIVTGLLVVAAAKNKRSLPKLSSLFPWSKHKEILTSLEQEALAMKKQLEIMQKLQHEQGNILNDLVEKTNHLDIKTTDIKKDTHFTAQVLKAALENNKGIIPSLLDWFKGRKIIEEDKTEQKKIK